VLKQHRGDGGVGVWRVERAADGALIARHAQRGSEPERMDMSALAARMAPYFEVEAGGHMIDQAGSHDLREGMVRAYLVEDRVAGFGHQAVNALHPQFQQPGPRLYHGADMPEFQALKQRLESRWITALRERVGVPRDQLPHSMDCDFIPAEPTAGEPNRFALCEINVSSVSPSLRRPFR
jgi:hypothetical protein